MKEKNCFICEGADNVRPVLVTRKRGSALVFLCDSDLRSLQIDAARQGLPILFKVAPRLSELSSDEVDNVLDGFDLDELDNIYNAVSDDDKEVVSAYIRRVIE